MERAAKPHGRERHGVKERERALPRSILRALERSKGTLYIYR